ncbi:MAG: hypothetical protein J2P33_18260, partial [Actinobacteria bacterium]|nr:hypothetical protein [Actinomycetota bacterium]
PQCCASALAWTVGHDRAQPQLARYLVLRRIWAHALTRWRDTGTLRRVPGLARLVDAGADPEILAAAVRVVVMGVVGDVIMVIDESYDPDAPEDAPYWTLAEMDSQGNLTGREIAGLHESLLDLDPEGVEGAGFF